MMYRWHRSRRRRGRQGSRALFQRFDGNGRALTNALAPSIIDELSGDLYVLASPEALTQRLTEILE